MKTESVYRQGWSILTRREQRAAMGVLVFGVFAALLSMATVGSIMPFLAVLSDPAKAGEIRALAWLRRTLAIESDYNFLILLGIGSIIMIVLGSVLQIVRNYVVTRFAAAQTHSISSRLLSGYLAQPYDFFLDRHTGDMGTRILAESGQVVNGFYKPLLDFVLSTLTVIALMGLLISVNPEVALLAFAVLGSMYAITFFGIRAVLRRLGRERVAMNQLRFRLAGEALAGVKDIKILGREQAYSTRFQHPSKAMSDLAVKSSLLSGIPIATVQAVAMSGMIILCLSFLTVEGAQGGNALGDIIPLLGVFALPGQRMMPDLGKLYSGLAKVQVSLSAVERVYDDLSTVAGPIGKISTPLRLKNHLVLENVHYRYPNAERPGLAEISLTIQAGETIGIVGMTGAGKTTLADVILGLLTPTEGRMLVDGTVIDADLMPSWRHALGYVPQDIFLTDASVAENIALGVAPEDIDRDQIERVAEIANLRRFVETELPEGFDTHVGERGVRLSGGQRQRIGIARALYNDAQLILFDEATSALDNLTEREVMDAIDALPGDKTILMIAHRLSTVRKCDKIIVLEQGRLVGFGPWDQLYATNSTFRRIAEINDAA